MSCLFIGFSNVYSNTVFPKVNWSWMDIWSSKGVWVTGPSIKFTGLSHTPDIVLRFLLVISSSNE